MGKFLVKTKLKKPVSVFVCPRGVGEGSPGQGSSYARAGIGTGERQNQGLSAGSVLATLGGVKKPHKQRQAKTDGGHASMSEVRSAKFLRGGGLRKNPEEEKHGNDYVENLEYLPNFGAKQKKTRKTL